jgi:hypothetical protein
MNRLPLYALILVVGVGLTLFVIRQVQNTEIKTLLEETSQEENQELFPITEVGDTQQKMEGFEVGTPYLFVNGTVQEEKIYVREDEDELGTMAVFKDVKGEEISFYSNVLFAVKEESFTKNIEQEIKNNKDVVDYKTLDALNMFVLNFESPYEAYLGYLQFVGDERLMGVGLDMKVTAYNDGGSEIMVQ